MIDPGFYFRCHAWLLRLRVRPEWIEFVQGDLEEGFRWRSSTPWSARLWLTRQTICCLIAPPRRRVVHREDQQQGAHVLASLNDDLRYAWRTLRHSAWYSAAVVGVLGVGLALATVVFAVVDGVLFKPLPFTRSSELFLVRADDSSQPRLQPPPVSWREIDAWREAAPDLTFAGISAAPNEYERAEGREYWSAGIDERFFDVLGTRPLLGGFRAEDFDWNFGTVKEGGTWQPVLVSYRMWRQLYGGDPSVVGRTFVTRQDETRTYGRRIVGILPRDFVFPIDAGPQPDALTPIARGLRRSSVREFQAVVRVPVSAGTTAAAERLRAATRRLAPPGDLPHQTSRALSFDDARLVGVPDQLAAEERPAFWLVASAATLMLLLACVNVAGLAVARNVERRRDLAVRRAIGASRWRLSRGLLMELLLLVAAGTGLALLLARPILVRTIGLLPPTVTLMKTPEIDGRVFTVMAMLAIAIVGIVSLWPARVAARVQPLSAMATGGGMSTPVGRRSRFVLVAVQVAFGFVPVTAGALTVASVAEAWRMDAGFTRHRTILLEAFLFRNEGAAARVQQFTNTQTALASLPGVEDVAVSSIQPLFARRNIPWTTLVPEDWSGPAERIAARRVTGNFFKLMGLELVSGRWPLEGEWHEAQHVAIVSRTAARMLWQGRSAIGQRLVHPNLTVRKRQPPTTVIGVVADARYQALDADPIGDIYVTDPITSGTTGVFFHARTRGAAERELSQAVAVATARGLRVEQATTHEDALFAALKHRVLPAWLFGSLGTAALLVLGVGILGLLAMSAAQRTRELGIRVALGATRAHVVRLLVREQFVAVLAGLVVGGMVSGWAVRYIGSELYGVQPYDPIVWTVVAMTIVIVSLAGALGPSIRAARVDPISTLRVE